QTNAPNGRKSVRKDTSRSPRGRKAGTRQNGHRGFANQRRRPCRLVDTVMSLEELFLDHLALIDRITAHICRINRVGATEGEDFASHVKFKLIEGNYAVIRKFEGRSTFS